ncbi:MAG TPA: hypothetical protein VHB25_15185 [Gemmatimonadaceae bacterium]|nr:hypothetical protein [Gemmatimonadaceae bacterium]
MRPDASDRAPRADGVLGVMEFGIARPAALSEIVVRALARDRDRRPRSAAELGAWLERVAVPA